MDMVCEQDLSSLVDFATDPIQTKIDGDWILGCGTTLGADNGIWIALALAVLITDIKAGPVECVFTVDEETGTSPADYIILLLLYLLPADRLDIDGLTGGHSGIEIYLGRANSVKLLAEFLHRISGAVL